jgi:hypothetical protein
LARSNGGWVAKLKGLRASMKVDFKNNKPFLKDTFQKLGYNDYFSDAKNGDHLEFV